MTCPTCVALKAELAEARERIAKLREALEQVRRTPTVPFPDRSAHSERAFADAVWRAWSRQTQIADAALYSTAPQTYAPTASATEKP